MSASQSPIPTGASRGRRDPADVLWHHGPSWLWLLSFVVVVALDVLALRRWVLLPLYVAGFYGGMIVIDLLTYPMLDRWRGWVKRYRERGLLMWYVVEVGAMWIGTTVVLALAAPVWLTWTFPLPPVVVAFGWLLLAGSVLVGVWAAGQMGWARLCFAGALFPPGDVAAENDVPQRLVVRGPYRYVRNPLYDTDMTLIGATALVTQNWGIVLLLVAYILQLAFVQLPLEERELRNRFGAQYERFLARVPRFIPRLRPVDPREIYDGGAPTAGRPAPASDRSRP